METETARRRHPAPPSPQFHHHEERNRRVRKGETKLTLENYLSFLESRDESRLTVSELNQIIYMHGFKKLQAKKVQIVEALKSIHDFTNPSRSTLGERISSQVFMTKNDVIKDLADLSWQECSVTSIKTFNSVPYAKSPSTAAQAILPWRKRNSRSETQLSTPGSSNSAKQTSSSVVAVTALAAGNSSGLSSENGKWSSMKRRKLRKKKLQDVSNINHEANVAGYAARIQEKAVSLALEYQ
ncbi:hypothetical protein Droror1_Dr00003138 [Drosera rotundifolia]